VEIDLVKGAPVVPEVSEGFARFVAGVVCFVVLAGVSAALTWTSSISTLIIIGVLAIFPSIFIGRRVAGPEFAALLHERFIVPRREIPLEFEAEYGKTTRVSGLKAPAWTYLAEEYRLLKSDYLAEHGRSAGSPPVPYQLVIATYALDGNQQVVTFSDGTSIIWHRSSKVIINVDDCPEVEQLIGRVGDDGAQKAADALGEIISILDEKYTAHSVLDIAERLGWHRKTEIARALEVAKWWNLIAVDKADSEHHLLRHGDEYYDSKVVLTQAGEDWHLASADLQPVRDAARRNVQNEPSNSPHINIGTFAGILNVGKNISGRHTVRVRQEQVSEVQLLVCIRQVLDLQEIPWSDPRLGDVREVMEEAVAQQNPRLSGMKQAVARLKETCEDVAVGVLGNGVFQLLVNCFT
jgi:hypothetical protein